MDFQIGLIVAGLVVGFIVGLTGVGPIYYTPLLLKWVAYLFITKKRILIGLLQDGFH